MFTFSLSNTENHLGGRAAANARLLTRYAYIVHMSMRSVRKQVYFKLLLKVLKCAYRLIKLMLLLMLITMMLTMMMKSRRRKVVNQR